MLHPLDLHFRGHTETIAAFLLETMEGPVLFETGPQSTYPRLVEALAEKGYRPEDLSDVFLTHIHLDHAGAAWALAEAGATIHVHPKGAVHLHDPVRLWESAERIYGEEMEELWGNMESIPKEQIVQVDHEAQYRIGGKVVTAWHTPGHAVHHIAWQIGNELIAGDVAGVKIGNGPVVPPCPPPDIQLEDWQRSIELLRNLGLARLWLTHFGMVRDVAAHLDELEGRLRRYADWIYPHYREQTPIDALTPLFQEMAEEDLRAHGVEAEGLIQYENANPAWMSVAGLLRYWRKKEN